MIKKFYFDTSIWIDIYFKRGKNGEKAYELLFKIIKKNYIVVYSDNIIIEFKKLNLSDFEINEILNVLKPNNLKRVHITKEQILEMNRISKQRNLPKKDVLHAIIARDHDAQLVTRDNHFQKLKDIIKSKIPED